MEKPRRKYEVELRASGDDWNVTLREIQRLAQHIEEHGPECDMVSGGYDTGSFIHVITNPNQTHDNYVAQLNEYLDELKLRGEPTRPEEPTGILHAKEG